MLNIIVRHIWICIIFTDYWNFTKSSWVPISATPNCILQLDGPSVWPVLTLCNTTTSSSPPRISPTLPYSPLTLQPFNALANNVNAVIPTDSNPNHLRIRDLLGLILTILVLSHAKQCGLQPSTCYLMAFSLADLLFLFFLVSILATDHGSPDLAVALCTTYSMILMNILPPWRPCDLTVALAVERYGGDMSARSRRLSYARWEERGRSLRVSACLRSSADCRTSGRNQVCRLLNNCLCESS